MFYIKSFWLILARLFRFTDPYFLVYHPKTEHCRSDVYDAVKKGDTCLVINLAQPKVICGDVMIEFFNKPKMKAKVTLSAKVAVRFNTQHCHILFLSVCNVRSQCFLANVNMCM